MHVLSAVCNTPFSPRPKKSDALGSVNSEKYEVRYDWSKKIEPNVAQKLCNKKVVVRFMN